jgi:regulator of replication initiation timing
LKDDIEEAIRNLHMDMISQFHRQSQELRDLLSMQMATIERLTEENEILRVDNERFFKGENTSSSDMSYSSSKKQ